LAEALDDKAARALLVGGETTQEATQEATQETTQEGVQGRILALLRSRPAMTRRELAEHIGLSVDGIKYHLDKLRAAGIIRHVGPTKAGQWEILK